MAFCSNCGSRLEEGQKFCTNCGAQVEYVPAAPQPPAAAAETFAAGAAVQQAPAPEGQGAYAWEERPEPQTAARPTEQPGPNAVPFRADEPKNKAANPNHTPDSTGDYDPADIASHKGMSVLAYFSVLVLIPLLAAKDSRYTRFHVNQGLLLLILDAIVVILRKFDGILHLIGTLGGFFAFVLFIIGVANAVKGRAKELPLIGKFRLLS